VDLDGALDGGKDRCELGQHTVAGGVEDPSAVPGDQFISDDAMG
jgi:hypothetical protein